MVNCIVNDTLIGVALTWLDLSVVTTLLGAGREIKRMDDPALDFTSTNTHWRHPLNN